MREAPERAAFAREALQAPGTEQRGVQELDGDARFVTTVAAMRQPHGAHPALAQQTLQRVAADHLARERGRDRGPQQPAVEEPAALDRRLLCEQRGQIVGHGAAVAAEQ